MGAKDRSKGGATDQAGKKVEGNSVAKAPAAAKPEKEPAAKVPSVASAVPAGKGLPVAPPVASQPEQPDNRPLHAGIDAMSILAEAEAKEQADVRKTGAPSQPPRSAAEVMARAIARDHPDMASRPARSSVPAAAAARPSQPARPSLPKAPPAPAKAKRAEVRDGEAAGGGPLVSAEDVAAVLSADHADPFSVLGMHQTGSKGAVSVRVFLPQASAVAVVDVERGKVVAELPKIHDEGFFAGEIAKRTQPFSYRLRVTVEGGEEEIDDAYRFPPQIADQDVALLAAGNHLRAWEVMGAHSRAIDGVAGATFAVWAPNARRVAVVGDFNDWDGRRHGMRFRHECGVWEIFVPGVVPGRHYKYEVKAADGTRLEPKADPYSFWSERPPGLASIVPEAQPFPWQDAAWMKKRVAQQRPSAPLSFYQVHLGSWRRKPEEGHRPLTYRELAVDMVDYVAGMNFTHLALLPVVEHTWDGTQGYLPSSMFSPTGRFGTPEDFKFLVDQCHRKGIGVVVDWVPTHMSSELQGLAGFDGTALYENPDPFLGRDIDWGTPVFDYRRLEVANYLIANALYWLDHYHLDGLRVGSLAKMLYLDYGRASGEWHANEGGGNENLDALKLIRRFNQTVAEVHPGAITVAEDTSLREMVTRPVSAGGLGFRYRWNVAWAYDTLRHLGRHPVHRKYYHYELTNPLLYAFNEEFVLPLSFDHVSIGRRPMLDKLPGDRWQKFATLRAWYGLMFGMPGKKLMFMGTEFAQSREWNSDISLDWHLLEDPWHQGMQKLIRDLNEVYRTVPALHELDGQSAGFEWIDFHDEDASVVSFLRYGKDRKAPAVVVSHFTPVIRRDYRVGVPEPGTYVERLNTDADLYGGGNNGNQGRVTAEAEPAHGRPCSIKLTLPPYSTVILERKED